MTHLLRYLLIFGDRKKKVELTVGKELENVKVETLKQKAKELFNLKNVLLQIWDKGFEDWVDLDEGDPTPTNSRIKVEVDKEAKSLSDINIAKRIPSSSAAVKSPMLVTTPKVDPPFVQVLSSHSSYPPIALTTTEVPIALPAQKSLPALSRLPQSHSQSVLSKQSSGMPPRTLPVGQRQPQQSQAPGHTSSSSVGKPILDLEDNSHIPTSARHQTYPTASSHSQERPVVDYIQQSFSLPSRIPSRTLSTSREDLPQRMTTVNLQNKPAVEVLQQSSQVPYAQSSRIPERPLPRSQENLPHRTITSCSQNKQTYMQSLRIPERSIPPSQDIAPNQHMTTQHMQNTPEVQQVVQEFCPSLPFPQTSSFPEKTLPPSQDLSLYRSSTAHSQNKPDGPVVQESWSSQPYPQTSKNPQRNLPPSEDNVHPIVIEDELSPDKEHEEEQQMEDVTCTSSLENDKLSFSDYKLPNFPPDIIQKLENGIRIEAKDRSILLDTLYDSVVPYTYYPSSSDYIYLTKMFLERFPQLIPQAGPIRDCLDTWEAWRQKLMHKFKNKRKRKDRDAPGVLQHKRMNCNRHFEGLDELQGATRQSAHDRRDLVDSSCPGEADDDIFEVVDDDRDDDSIYHVMDADTSNSSDTPDVSFARESLRSPPCIQTSRTPGRIKPLFQDPLPNRLNTLPSQNMECVQKSLSSPPHMQSIRILERNLLPSQDNVSNQDAIGHLGNKSVMEVVQVSGSPKSYMQTLRSPERSLPPSQDQSQDNVPIRKTVPYLQTPSVIEVEQQSGSSLWCRQTSKIPESALHTSRDHTPTIITEEELSSSTGQEESLSEAQQIRSTASCNLEKPSLYDYRLPKFPADIIQKLEHGIPIEAKDRSVLLDTLYESVVPYTYYPSAADYIYLTNIFLEQYPQLLPQAGPIRDCPDNWEAWRQKLMHKFKNKRKRKDRDAPAVREHSRKNFRYFEGLDELQSSSGQAPNEREDLVDSDYPGEADDEVFEVVDDDQDVLIKEEHSAHHMMAADSTNLGDTPVKEGVHESSPYIQYPWIPERNLALSQDDASYRPPTSLSQNKPVLEIAHEFCSSEQFMQTSGIQEKTSFPSHELAPPPMVKEDLLPSASHREEQMEVQHEESAPAVASDKPSLYDYKLPKFPADIIQKLERGIAIEARDRSVLLDTLYESIVPYTYYPSASDYIYFTNIFLERFPQLLPQAGPIRDCSDNWEAWRQKLMHKFKNKRKRKDRDAPAVREHSRKNFRYFEGLDELQSSSGQALNERGNLEDRDCPGESDDEVFEVVDDVQDITIKDEDSMYHVMAADTTNQVDT